MIGRWAIVEGRTWWMGRARPVEDGTWRMGRIGFVGRHVVDTSVVVGVVVAVVVAAVAIRDAPEEAVRSHRV